MFDVFDNASIRMSIPYTKGPYIWEHEYDGLFFVILYYSYYSLLQTYASVFPMQVGVGHLSDMIKRFKMQIIICQEAVQPKAFDKQKINAEGKRLSKQTRLEFVRCRKCQNN